MTPQAEATFGLRGKMTPTVIGTKLRKSYPQTYTTSMYVSKYMALVVTFGMFAR